jgi:hypothetical protein
MIPEEIVAIFGPPPLLATEDRGVYDRLLSLAACQLQPADVIGWLLIKSLADQFFEVARYRRFLAAHISAVHTRMIADTAAGASPRKVLEDLAEIFDEIRCRPSYRAELSALPNASEPTESDFAALLPEWIGGYEQLARLLRAAERRLSETRTELEHHHRGLGEVLRKNLHRTIETQVKPQPAPEGPSLVPTTSSTGTDKREATRLDSFHVEEEAAAI